MAGINADLGDSVYQGALKALAGGDALPALELPPAPLPAPSVALGIAGAAAAAEFDAEIVGAAQGGMDIDGFE
ncbi:unnamed protein product, partial [Prorocentrum cordatum]